MLAHCPGGHRATARGTALLLACVLITADVLLFGPLAQLDLVIRQAYVRQYWPELAGFANSAEEAGLRGLTVPIAFVVIAYLSRRHQRPWAPVLFVLAELALNVVIGGGKVLSGRLHTQEGDPTALVPGGMAFPSGHASNAVLTWGLVAWALRDHLTPRLLRRTVVGVSLLVGACTIYRNTHWLTDIVVGWGIAALLLALTIGYERAIEAGAVADPTARIRGRLAALRSRRAHRRAQPPAAGPAHDRPRSARRERLTAAR